MVVYIEDPIPPIVPPAHLGNIPYSRLLKKAFVASILSGKFHNQAAAGAESAMSCMMARTAAYTGREITWEETLRSKEVWDAHLDLNKLVAK